MSPPVPAPALAAEPVAEGPRGQRSRRWRRRFRILLAALAVAYAVLWMVRLIRDFEPVAARPFLAGEPLVFAHRGASAVAAEHTIGGYRRALADGADVLELDVHLARDGAIVVSHDRSLERTFGVPWLIAEHDLPALRGALAARHVGADPTELLPTLEDVIAAFPGTRLNIELKAQSDAMADAVAAAIDRRGIADQVLVASFDGDVLRRFRQASRGRVATSASLGEAARFYVCYLIEVPCRPAYEALQIPPSMRRSWPRFRLDTQEFVAFAHRHGLEVHYWTIDQPAEIARLLAIGADGIMTNDPARALAARSARR